MGRRLTVEYIRGYFEEQGCEMLEEEYKNNRTKMKYICSCGSISQISFDNFKKGHRCMKCGGNENFTLEYVYNCFKDEGCELLEKKYINRHELMKYKCICGNIDKISLANFKQGKRCRSCGIVKLSGDNHYLWIKDRKIFKENYKFRKKCRNLLTKTLSKINQKKTDKTYNILGYTAEELKDHIYGHSNWKNIKNDQDFHIDHIFPIKAFLDYDIKDPQLISCLDNLQPLSKKDNLSKYCKYDKKEFENWLKDMILQDIVKNIVEK